MGMTKHISQVRPIKHGNDKTYITSEAYKTWEWQNMSHVRLIKQGNGKTRGMKAEYM